jgi:hypothetical protein
MKRWIFLVILFCTLSVTAFAQNITFKASSEKTVVVNQQFRVNFTLATPAEQNGKNFQAPEFKGFEVLFDLQQQSYSSSNINGKQMSSQTLSFIYTLVAKQEGTFTIPAATIKVGNSEYKSNELTINVLPADKTANTGNNTQGNAGNSGASGNQEASVNSEDVFMRMHVSKTSVYENEGFLVTFKLYSREDISGIESYKFPEYEGFIAQEIEMKGNPQWNMEPYNGRNYRTVVLKQTILFPQHAGKIPINSGKFDVIANIRNQRRQRSIFDDFFDTATPVKKTLTTAPVTINVKELPSGKPASFSGAVGDYKMTSSISTTDLKANDAVTVKISISGEGNIKLIKNPVIVFPNDFEPYDPVVNTSSKITQSGVSGTKTIEYNAIPRFAGDFVIPKAEFSYFDLKTGAYKTLTSEEYTLHIAQGEAGNGGSAPIINSTNKEDIRFLGKDIRYIKISNAHFNKGSFFFGTLGYGLFYIIPALLFIVFFIIYRKQAAENANIALVRTKKANKVASKRLKSAHKYLKENKQEAFYDEILKAVWGYLSDKLNIPVSALTKDNVEANLIQYGASETLIQDFRNILDTSEFARFAPSQGSGAMDELYNSTVQAIDLMENTIKK